MDVEIVSEGGDDMDVRLIELNAFGAEFSAGSGLFHWIRDDHILCPAQDHHQTITIRVLSPFVEGLIE